MSNTQPKMTLRELAKEYAGGRIDRQTFRRRRDQLLDELAANAASQPKPRITQHASAKPAEPVGKGHEKSAWIIIGGIFAFSIILLAGGLLFFREPSPPLSPETAETSPSPSPASEIQPRVIAPEPDIPVVSKPSLEEIIEAFVRSNDWSPQSRRILQRQWADYDREEQVLVKGTSWFHALSAELRALIEEERGLAGGKASLTADSLVAFGSSLGLEYALRTPEPAPAPAKPEKKGRTVPSPKPVSPKPVKRSDEPVTLLTRSDDDAANQPAISPERQRRDTPEEKPDTRRQQQAESVELRADVAVKGKAPQTDETRVVTTSPGISETRAPAHSASEAQQESCRPHVADRRISKCRDRLKNGGKGPWLRLLPGGLFSMGSDAVAEESPSHPVHIAYPFAMSMYEISQGEFNAFCRDTGYPCPEQPRPGDDYPVVNVSWEDAKRYAQWLTRKTGRGYRLPTESEWEYAARAYSTGPYPLPEADLGTYAHYSRHGRENQPLPRRPQRTNPNAFGLFHMAGNVKEWVIDDWGDSYQGAPRDGSPRKQLDEPMGVTRGGSYADDKSALRSSARAAMPKAGRDALSGFRLVRDVYLETEGEILAKWGDWWLSYQRDDQFAIQLFAVNRLDKVSRIIGEFPDIAFKVVGSRGQAARYRLCVGLFETEQDARAGFQGLPEKLRRSANGYLVKSIAEIRQSAQ